jgi:hypothetical protein
LFQPFIHSCPFDGAPPPRASLEDALLATRAAHASTEHALAAAAAAHAADAAALGKAANAARAAAEATEVALRRGCERELQQLRNDHRAKSSLATQLVLEKDAALTLAAAEVDELRAEVESGGHSDKKIFALAQVKGHALTVAPTEGPSSPVYHVCVALSPKPRL